MGNEVEDDHARLARVRRKVAYLKRMLPWPSGQPSHHLSKREEMLREIDALQHEARAILARYPDRYKRGRPARPR